jgi:hypothetical protein
LRRFVAHAESPVLGGLPAAALRVRSRGRRGRRLASPYLAGSSRPHGRNPAGKPGSKDTGRRWPRTASAPGTLGAWRARARSHAD